MEPSDLTRKIKINIKSNFNDILTNNRDKSIGGMNSFSRIQQKDSLINSASSKDESIKGPSLYSDEEDDCPNFVYSVDAMEVAKEVDPANLQKNGSKESADVQPQEEHEETERDEDLVQLDDDEEDLRTSTESILEEQNKSDNKTLDLNLYNDSSDFDDDLQEDADLGRTPLCNKSGKSLQNADIEVEAEDSQVIDEARSGKKSKEMRHPNEGQDEDEDDIDNLNLTESISDDENINLERSYTPCLDEHFQLEKDKQEELNDSEEKQDDESKSSKKAAELDGIETEMISEEDDEDFSKNKTNDLSLARKKEHDLSKDFVLEKDDTKSRSEFKKVSKSTKGRNYRDKINPFSPRSTPAPHNNKENRNRRRSRSRSRSSHTKERSGRRRQSRSSSRHRSKRTQRSSPVRRRKDLERYDVRNVVDKNKQSSRSTNNLNNNNNKDEYGRDLVSARRRSRSQTPTRPPVIRKSVSSSLSLSSRSSSSSESSYYKRKRRSGGIMRRRTRSRSYNNFSHEVDNHNAGFADDRRSRRESNHVPRKRSISVESKGTKRPKTSDSHSKSYRYSSPSPRKNVNKRPTNPDDTKRGRKRTKSYTKRDNTPINVVSSPYAVANDHENHSSDDRWTPPLANDDKRHKESTKKNVKEKKKKSKNRKRDRSEQSKPSKEVFASGDNILVSISFNNKSPTQTTSSSTHHHHHEPAALDIQQQTIVTIPKELNSTSLNANLSKSKSDTRNKSDSKSGGRRTESRKSDSKRLRGKDSLNAAAKKHKKLELDKVKPVAIIDLDRSPFKELTPSPKAVIVLSDSENEEEVQEQPIIEATQLKDNCQNVDITNETCQPDRNSECESSLGKQVDEILGPKTPPEPSSSSSSSNSLIKFSLSKSKVKLGKNALGNEEEAEVDADVGDNTTDNPAPVENSDANKLLNTPPGSPDDDVYNPFEPTKSPSPDPANGSNMQLQQINSSSEKLNNDAIISTNTNSKPDENHSSPSTLNQMDMMLAFITSSSSQLMKNINNTDSTDLSNNKKDINMEDKINVISNVLLAGPNILGNVVDKSLPNNTLPPLFNLIEPSISNQSGCSKDIPKDKSKLPTQQQSNDVTDKAGVNNKPKSTLELFDSPYSPGSSDYEDLFEPPGNMSPPSSQNTVTPQKKSNSKIDLIDDLFGGSSPPSSSKKTPNSLNKRQSGATSAMAIAKSRRNLGLFSALPFPPTSKSPHKTRTSKGSRNQNSNKLNENQIRILDDIPSSAVEMQVKDKFLIKLNRQERVVEEVKLVLKPHYNKKHIDKEDYKEILRRSVPKICHSRSGEINPKKIQDLIEAYVHKFRHQKKRHKQ